METLSLHEQEHNMVNVQIMVGERLKGIKKDDGRMDEKMKKEPQIKERR